MKVRSKAESLLAERENEMSTKMYDYETRMVHFNGETVNADWTKGDSDMPDVIPAMVHAAKEFDYLSEQIERNARSLANYASKIAESVAKGENMLSSGMPVDRLTADIMRDEAKREQAATMVRVLVFTLNQKA